MMGNFASITSAISSTVSSPWVASSSNIYFNAGSVGIGSSAPARALDVNGSVNVSGSLYAGGSSLGALFPKAAGAFYWNGSSVTVVNSYNISSITSSVAGNYVVSFANAFASANYIVVTGFQRMGAADFVQHYGRSTNLFVLEFWSSGSMVHNTSIVHFVVF